MAKRVQNIVEEPNKYVEKIAKHLKETRDTLTKNEVLYFEKK